MQERALVNSLDIQDLISQGESSCVEFKNVQVNAVSLAEEIVAFANSDGGIILAGIEVVNAVTHRDYTLSGSAIRLFVFENRVEINSPGGLCNTLTLASLPYRQFTRNQTLASFLSGLGYMERRGKGILRMQKLCRERGIECQIALTPDQSELVVCFLARQESPS